MSKLYRRRITVRDTRTFPDDGEPLRARLLPNGDRVLVRKVSTSSLLVRIPGVSGRLPVVLDRWVSERSIEAPVVVDGGGGHLLYTRNGERFRMDLKDGKRVPTKLEGPDMRMAAFVW